MSTPARDMRGYQTKVLIPRQIRYPDEEKKLTVTAGGTTFQVNNYSRYGIGLLVPKSQDSLPEKMAISVTYVDEVIYHGHATVANRRPADQVGMDVVGLSLEDEILIEKLFGSRSADGVMTALHREMVSRKALHPDFREFVDNLSHYLKKLQQGIRAEEEKARQMTLEEKEEYYSSFKVRMSEIVRRDLIKYSQRLDEIMQKVDWQSNPFYISYMRERISPLFEEAEICRRAFEKPLPYANDFEMLNQIHRNGFEGKTLFGQVAHHCIINGHGSRSLRVRRSFFYNLCRTQMKNSLSAFNHSFKVLAIAPGPGIEIQDLIRTTDQTNLGQCQFDFLDIDDKPLIYIQTKLNKILHDSRKHAKLRYIRTAMSEELKSSARSLAITLEPERHVDTYDFIYVPTYFDYLDTTMGKRFIAKLVLCLKAGGRLVIANFVQSSPAKAFYHLITDWSIVYKSDEEMRTLAPAGFRCSLEKDEEGVSQFLTIQAIN